MNRALLGISSFSAILAFCAFSVSCLEMVAEDKGRNVPVENSLRADVLGYWQIVEDGELQSAVFFYRSGAAVYGKMVAIYDGGKISETLSSPKERSKGIKGAPYICGLDFIYGLIPNSKGVLQGKVVDPDTGRIFDCEVWIDKKSGNLVVRGKFLFFGKNEYWPKLDEKDLPAGARINPVSAEPNLPFIK